MTRLRAILADLAAFVRGEPIIALTLAGIVGDIATQIVGDGIQRGEVARIVAAAVLAALGRSVVTPTANPMVRTIQTEPPILAPVRPVITLRGRR